jgi:NADP-dependent 3-hydroxy acid dehydrogenase YdfG
MRAAPGPFADEYDSHHIQRAPALSFGSQTVKIDNAVALVTGANRGIGLAFTRELLARGARKVYAGARDPSSITLPGVEPLRLDVTKPDDITAAVTRAGDVTLVDRNV